MQAAFFTTADWQPIDRIRFSAGLRHDDIRDDYANAALPPPASPPGRRASARRSASAAPATRIRSWRFVQLAHAFKAPTLEQLFDPRPFPVGDGIDVHRLESFAPPATRAQRRDRLEPHAQSFAWSVAAYRMNVTDEIDFDPTFYTYRNIGSSRHTGIEASLDAHSSSCIRPLLTYAWTHVTATDQPGQQLKNIPEHVAQLDLRASLATLGRSDDRISLGAHPLRRRQRPIPAA